MACIKTIRIWSVISNARFSESPLLDHFQIPYKNSCCHFRWCWNQPLVQLHLFENPSIYLRAWFHRIPLNRDAQSWLVVDIFLQMPGVNSSSVERSHDVRKPWRPLRHNTKRGLLGRTEAAPSNLQEVLPVLQEQRVRKKIPPNHSVERFFRRNLLAGLHCIPEIYRFNSLLARKWDEFIIT